MKLMQGIVSGWIVSNIARFPFQRIFVPEKAGQRPLYRINPKHTSERKPPKAHIATYGRNFPFPQYVRRRR